MKPIVGISMSREAAEGYPRDFLRATYIEAVRRAGAVPLLLANCDESVSLLELCDGLLLTGGGDVDPTTFGAADDGTEWAGVSPDRDRTELALIAAADHLNLPVFGICRGMQVMAVAYGGTLIQDIPRRRPDSALHHSQKESRERVTHSVDLEPDSRAAEVAGNTHFEVNSFHHQAVDRMPDGWRVVGRASDQLVEAMERPGERYLLGVQWHPEDLATAHQPAQQLFEKFVEACLAYQAGREQHVGRSR